MRRRSARAEQVLGSELLQPNESEPFAVEVGTVVEVLEGAAVGEQVSVEVGQAVSIRRIEQWASAHRNGNMGQEASRVRPKCALKTIWKGVQRNILPLYRT